MGQGWGEEEARQGVWLEAHLSIGRAGSHLTRFPSQRLPLVGTGSEARRALTSTLVMSQSLTALLWTPLVTIWKPLAVAVWSSTEDGGGEDQPEPGGCRAAAWGFPDQSRHAHHPSTPDSRGSV